MIVKEIKMFSLDLVQLPTKLDKQLSVLLYKHKDGEFRRPYVL